MTFQAKTGIEWAAVLLQWWRSFPWSDQYFFTGYAVGTAQMAVIYGVLFFVLGRLHFERQRRALQTIYKARIARVDELIAKGEEFVKLAEQPWGGNSPETRKVVH